MSNGKGSAMRKDPTGKARKKFDEGWDRIFGKKPSQGTTETDRSQRGQDNQDNQENQKD